MKYTNPDALMSYTLNLDEIRSFGNVKLLAQQLVEGFITGLHKSPYHGFSVEFAEHRPYNASESTRHIDWKLYAKTDKLYTKRYEEETNLRAYLVIDNSSSMYYPEKTNKKITFSITAAACLAHLLQKQRDAVGLFSFSNKVEFETPAKSNNLHIHKLFLQMQRMLNQEESKSTDLPKVLHEIAEKTNKRSLIILFSDLQVPEDKLNELFAALQHMKHNKHEILLFQTIEKSTELDFEFDDRPYEFIDIESGDKLKIQPHQLKKIYQDRTEAYQKAIDLKCGQFKIDHNLIDVNTPFSEVMTQFLIKRKNMI